MNQGNMLRLFVAVDLPEALRLKVMALAEKVSGVRWVESEQLHITLRFLGATPLADLKRIKANLAEVRAPCFDLQIHGVGIFPPAKSRKPPRVLWLGLQPDSPLRELKAEIDGVLGPDPEMAGREYSPHLTLGRFTSRPREDLNAFLVHHTDCDFGTWKVDSFHLYRSTLKREGALHEVVGSYVLKEPLPLL
jgi:2'-5' RNA ligase